MGSRDWWYLLDRAPWSLSFLNPHFPKSVLWNAKTYHRKNKHTPKKGTKFHNQIKQENRKPVSWTGYGGHRPVIWALGKWRQEIINLRSSSTTKWVGGWGRRQSKQQSFLQNFPKPSTSNQALENQKSWGKCFSQQCSPSLRLKLSWAIQKCFFFPSQSSFRLQVSESADSQHMPLFWGGRK